MITPTKKIFFSLILLGLTLLLAEIAARMIVQNQPQKSSEFRQAFRPHPFLNGARKANFSSREHLPGQVNFNNYGFRGQDISLQKPDNTLRVMVVGGSSTENWYVPDDDTFSEKLEKLLEAELRPWNVEVLNAGVSGYASTHSLINVALWGLRFDLDAVLVYHGINDLNRAFKDEDTLWMAPPEHKNLIDERPWPVKHSALLQSFNQMWSNLPDATPVERVKVLDTTGYSEVFLRNMKSLKGLGLVHGFQVIVATQLHMFDAEITPDIEEKLWVYKAVGPDIHWETHRQGLQTFNQNIRSFCRQENLICADVAAQVKADLHHLLDDVHMTEAGTSAVAQALLQPTLKALQKQIKP